MFDWRDYLGLAEDLARDRYDEAALRSAISRAYYAVYHRASRYVRSQTLVPAHIKLSHHIVWTAIRITSNPNRQEAGNRGDALKAVRLRADYHTAFPGDLQKATRDALVEAREIIDLIDVIERTHLSGAGPVS